MAPKYKFDPNLLIALGVLIASFAALFVYMQQASIMREQSNILLEQTKILFEQTKANAWPNVKISLNRSFVETGDDYVIDKYSITLVNRGIGPAIFEGVVVRYQDEVLLDWDDFYEAIDLPDSISQGHANSMAQDLVIAPNDVVTLIHWNNNLDFMRYMFPKADQLSIELCYKSVYGDHWRVKREGFQSNMEKNVREAVEDCEMRAEDLFEE